MEKIRLDVLLLERGLVESRSLAQRLVMAGQVRVDGQVVLKPATKVDSTAGVTIEQGPPYVSRGGEKLAHALAAFKRTDLTGWVCADVGASTGGFTDCMLQAGAAKVYAIDVGYGILHWKLRTDPRVAVMERTNARFVIRLPEPVRLVTIDASFISLKTLLPVILNWFGEAPGEVIALIKPQFEAGRAEVARGEGVVRDPSIHKKVLRQTIEFVQPAGFRVLGLTRSPLTGPKGNTEFLIHLSTEPGLPSDPDHWVLPLFAGDEPDA
jgi:23S rRNA (cytidine1920-2'-O)/16S rRNA (cytidine1409-2'-O)-methyltransferase